jgi:hypothetical protein
VVWGRAFSAGFLAADRVFEAAGFVGAADLARVGFADPGLEDFLRVFLDIRLPFVAFGGSIITVLRASSGEPESRRALGKFDGPGVGYKELDAPLVRLLNGFAGRGDE